MEGLGRLAASRLSRAASGETDGRDWPQIVAGGRTLADALPDLLVEARQVAMTTSVGWHGRRRAGARRELLAVPPLHRRRTGQAHRLAPLGPGQPSLCA